MLLESCLSPWFGFSSLLRARPGCRDCCGTALISKSLPGKCFSSGLSHAGSGAAPGAHGHPRSQKAEPCCCWVIPAAGTGFPSDEVLLTDLQRARSGYKAAHGLCSDLFITGSGWVIPGLVLGSPSEPCCCGCGSAARLCPHPTHRDPRRKRETHPKRGEKGEKNQQAALLIVLIAVLDSQTDSPSCLRRWPGVTAPVGTRSASSRPSPSLGVKL